MHLILSSSSPWNTNYCNEAGQALFKAEAPGWCLFGRNIKISRVVPPSIPADRINKEHFDDAKTLVGHDHLEDTALRDVFQPVGEVEYHVFKNSHIKYGGRDQSVNEFFSSTGFGFYGRNRLFIGPDGREYVWKMSANVCKLFLNDPAKTAVATFHRKHWGIFSPKRPASLEIFPPGEHMVELILITFIYMEKLRSDRERSTGGDGGGGDGGGGGGD